MAVDAFVVKSRRRERRLAAQQLLPQRSPAAAQPAQAFAVSALQACVPVRRHPLHKSGRKRLRRRPGNSSAGGPRSTHRTLWASASVMMRPWTRLQAQRRRRCAGRREAAAAGIWPAARPHRRLLWRRRARARPGTLVRACSAPGRTATPSTTTALTTPSRPTRWTGAWLPAAAAGCRLQQQQQAPAPMHPGFHSSPPPHHHHRRCPQVGALPRALQPPRGGVNVWAGQPGPLCRCRLRLWWVAGQVSQQ